MYLVLARLELFTDVIIVLSLTIFQTKWTIRYVDTRFSDFHNINNNKSYLHEYLGSNIIAAITVGAPKIKKVMLLGWVYTNDSTRPSPSLYFVYLYHRSFQLLNLHGTHPARYNEIYSHDCTRLGWIRVNDIVLVTVHFS